MSWTSAETIRKQIERFWNNGDLLRALVGETGIFPLRLRLAVPSSREIAAEFGRAREWVAMLQCLPGLRVEWRNVNSHTLGRQQLPAELWLDTAESAVAHLGKEAEADRFIELHAETRQTFPRLLPWVVANPNKALALASVWPRLLQVVAWKAGPAFLEPVYPRQVDLPGVDTKFIEKHGPILSELSGFLMPAAGGDPRIIGDLRVRHGFLREPARIRFRLLDPNLRFANLPGCPDVELDEGSFARLRLPVERVFMTENKTSFLTFPPVKRSLIVFGSGYGMRPFRRAQWVHQAPLYYWGDIDTHGFAILSQLREAFSHAQSFLMDEATFIQHRTSWVTEPSPAKGIPANLTASEAAVCHELQKDGRWHGARLEQEKIPLAAVSASLHALLTYESEAARAQAALNETK